jgi:hypothetical protein
MVYVKNNGQYKLTFSAVKTTEVKDGAGRVSLVKTPVFTKEFGVRIQDSLTGQIHHTGFTQLDEKVYKELFDTSVPFMKAIKAGTLSKYDVAPPEALLDSELLDGAQREISALRAEIESLNEIISSGGGKTTAQQVKDSAKAVSDMKAIIDEQGAEIARLKAELESFTAASTESQAEPSEDETPEF